LLTLFYYWLSMIVIVKVLERTLLGVFLCEPEHESLKKPRFFLNYCVDMFQVIITIRGTCCKIECQFYWMLMDIFLLLQIFFRCYKYSGIWFSPLTITFQYLFFLCKIHHRHQENILSERDFSEPSSNTFFKVFKWCCLFSCIDFSVTLHQIEYLV
jgi:hypothetical protein